MYKVFIFGLMEIVSLSNRLLACLQLCNNSFNFLRSRVQLENWHDDYVDIDGKSYFQETSMPNKVSLPTQ